jgi:hypothetical protein
MEEVDRLKEGHERNASEVGLNENETLPIKILNNATEFLSIKLKCHNLR